jgi:hypothetical protein
MPVSVAPSGEETAEEPGPGEEMIDHLIKPAVEAFEPGSVLADLDAIDALIAETESVDPLAALIEASKENPEPLVSGRPTIAKLEELIARQGSEGVSILPDGQIATRIGLQPDGSWNYVINIGEEYHEAVRQWASGEDLTPEEWLSRQLVSYLESWGSAPKGR